MVDRIPEWKATGGYTIHEKNGIARQQEDRACTLHFYLAEKGDVLHLLDDKYEYAVATYGIRIDPKYIYTYDYQPEENWTEYRHDFEQEKLIREDYVFEEKVYFRVVFRNETKRKDTFRLDEILQWRMIRRIGGAAGTEQSGLQEENTRLQAESSRPQEKNNGAQAESSRPQEKISGPQTDSSRLQEENSRPQAESSRVKEDSGQQTDSSRSQEERSRLQEDIRRETESTASTVCGRQAKDSLNFLLMTDSHYTVNGTWEDTLYDLHLTIDALKDRGISLDGFLHLGDATDGLVQAEITRDYVKAIQEDIRNLGLPLYYVLGNHDSNYFRNNPERFSEEEMRELYLSECGKSKYGNGFADLVIEKTEDASLAESEEVASDKAYERKQVQYPVVECGIAGASSIENEWQEAHKTYYYQDFTGNHLRMIFLDSFNPNEKVRYGFHEEELDWLEDVLRQTPLEWYVLVLSHVPPTPRLHYWSKEIRGSDRLLQILRNFQRRSKKGAVGTVCESRAKVVSYGKLLGFIHGHNHADQIDYEEGFPIISIGCNKCEYFEEKKPAGAIAYQRVLGTISQDLWDVLVISTENETMDFVRFGAGEDRHISLAGQDNSATAEAVGGYAGEKIKQSRQDIQSKQNLQNEKIRSSQVASDWQKEIIQPGMRKPEGSRREETPMKKVITYGTFDLFHEGHYNLLKRAKALGDYLIVGVTTEHYDEQRGKINIVDSLLERIENVRSTGLVDEIIIEDHEGQKIEDVQKYDADIFTVGSDWKGTFDYLKSYCQVVYLERTPDISSTMLRKGKFPIIRMGIVGTGRIAPRFISEAKYVSGLNVQSVYNPHRKSVQSFAARYFLDSYSEDFESFLDAVDAIYIASPHETHYDYTRRALLAGKHVLCEKPMALSRKQTEELFSLAKEKQLILMEGIKTAYCPGFAQLISVAKSGKIGEIRDVEACFSRLTDPQLREMVDTRYGGAFLEFGSYTVLPIVKLLGGNYEKIKISSIPAENGVDLYTKIYFDYPEGMATSKTGIGVKSEGQLLISGTKGYILAESPWWLTRKFQVRYEDPSQIETYTPNFLGDGLRYEIGEFALRINGRGGHSFKLTEEETLAMAGVVECFMEERGRQREEFRKRNRESGVKIWAHRGASYRYPENTLEAFRAACELPGLAGIELDIQLSKDGEIVVFHDETLDRLMDRTGNVRDYTLQELQGMYFKDWRAERGREEPGDGFVGQGLSGDGFIGQGLLGGCIQAGSCEGLSEMSGNSGRACTAQSEGGLAGTREGNTGNQQNQQADINTESTQPYIPSMREVLALVRPYAQDRGVQINIELKNSRIPYEGMEEKILALVEEYGMKDFVVYSSFNGDSIKYLKELDGSVRTGILQSDIRDCLRLAEETRADALHPNVDSMMGKGVAGDSLERKVETGRVVRAWTGREPFYGQDRQYMVYDLEKSRQAGVTDFITNVPEEYLGDGKLC